MSNYQEIFINNLKLLRKKKNLTQWQLAELCEISNGTIGNIECGTTKPSFDLMIKFANVLEVHPSLFFQSEEIKTQEKENPLPQIKQDLINFIEKEFNQF